MTPKPLTLALSLAALGIAGLAATAAADDHTHGASPAPIADLQDPTRAHLLMLLSHYEVSPKAADLAAIGVPDLQGALIAAAQDASLPNIARGRALSALGALPLDGSRAYLTDTLATMRDASDARGLDEIELYLAGHLVRLIGHDLAPQDPAWAMTTLEPWILHPDIGVREWAVASLGKMRALPEAQPWADAHLMHLLLAERSPAVREALDRTLDGVTVLRPPSGEVRRSLP
jgi:hypothetical protein